MTRTLLPVFGVLSLAMTSACGGSGHPAAPSDAGAPADAGAPVDAGDPVHPITPTTVCGEPAALPADVLLDVGHPRPVVFVARSKSRVLSVDGGGVPTHRRWILWDPATASQVASGFADAIPVGSSSAVFVVPANGNVEIRSMDDGQLRGTIPLTSARRFGLSFDGSYVWGASTTALSTWSLTGASLVSRPGNYDSAGIFASTTQLQVVSGPAGQDLIELVATTDGSQSGTVTYTGQFGIFFVDGQHFTTTQEGYTRLYDLAGTQLWVGLDKIDGGTGDFAWRSAGIFRISDLSTPALTFDHFAPTQVVGNIIAFAWVHDVHIIRLDAGPLHDELLHTPMAVSTAQSFGLDEAGNWATADASGAMWGNRPGDGGGVVYARGTESDPIAAAYLGCGLVADVAGAPTGRVAAAIGDHIHVIDTTSGKYEGSLPVVARKLAITDDGNTLVAESGDLVVLAWPSGATIHMFSPGARDNYFGPQFSGWSLATSMGLLARTAVTYHIVWYPTGRQISDLAGTMTLLSDMQEAQFLLSPSGKRIETPWFNPGFSGPCATGGIHFFDANGQPTNSSTFAALGWINDDQLLAQDWTTCTTVGETRIYDSLGNLVANPPPLPRIAAIKPVSDTRVYATAQNTIYDLTTGSVAWSSPLPLDGATVGAIAGPKVVFASDGRLHAERY